MGQPVLTEIYTDGGRGLVAWPATDLRRAISSLGDLDDDATARACAAIKAGREGREGPIAWHPLPDPVDAITEALRAAYDAMAANHILSVVETDDLALALRDGAGLVVSLGAPPDDRPAPALTPIAVRTPRGLTWAAVPHLARVAAEEVDAVISHALSETAARALALHLVHRYEPLPPAVEGADTLGAIVESLPGCPRSGPWVSLARVGGRPASVYRWDSAMGGPAYGMMGLDDVTAGRLADATGVSLAEARAIRERALEGVL